jgi:hypothetical protein
VEDISLVKNNKRGHLPVFGDPGGVPQDERGGYRLTMDRKPVPGTPRKGSNTISTTKAEEDQGATIDKRIWPRGPVDPFWKMFPPLEIDKPPAPKTINDTPSRDHVTHAMGLRSD